MPQYIADKKRQSFIIHFENADTAGADAQDVIIRDTLDKTRFDISSVTLGDVVVANRLYRVPKGRSQFTLQKSLANRPGIFLRITGKTDTAAGVITWTFSSIDSATMSRPPFYGFLKPNINKPEGEASISYEINPLPNLTDETVLSSQASIVFDNNKPIATDVWNNKLDLLPPTSQVVSATHIYDSTFMLRFSGADASSGIGKYYVYFSTNGGPWKALAATDADSLLLRGQPDSVYQFYSIAADRVQNIEAKAPVAEATLKIPPLGVETTASAKASFNIFPNPASGQAYMQLSLRQDEEVDIRLQSVTGTEAAKLWRGRLHGSTTLPLNIGNLPAGLYIVVLKTSGRFSDTAKLSVVR